MNIDELVAISRFYGENPDYVLGGGGNTSWKDSETLYVKGSGMALADATPDSFVRMDRKALAQIWEKQYPQASAERESAVLADMMAARKPGEDQKRPSVEALLHDLLPFSFVVHLHPALVNGLTCSQRGESAMTEIFGTEAIWIPSINPGYVLSKAVKTAMDASHQRCEYSTKHGTYREAEGRGSTGTAPAIVFLQNHGVFVGNDSADGVKELYGEIMHKIGAWIQRKPDFSDEWRGVETAAPFGDIIKTLSELAGTAICMRGNEIASLVQSKASFAPVASAFTPDHIVYAGSDPMFTEETIPEGIREAWKNHVQKIRVNPKIIAVQGMGIFGAAPTEKSAGLALDLFKDTIKISVYAESFGGPLFMAHDEIDFINNWEVERFRASVSLK